MVVGKGVREVRGVKMRSLRKNSRKLYYSAYEDEQPIYATDKKGDIVYDDVDGDLIPRIIDYQSGYGEPKEFFGNIAFAATVRPHYGRYPTVKFHCYLIGKGLKTMCLKTF